MGRVCRACGESLDGAHPAKRYCGDACKKRYQRGARAVEGDDEPAGDGLASTEAATMLELAELGKLGTPGGQAALVLARRIDASHRDTGAGLASMVKRLQDTLESLTEGSQVVDDPLDEFTRRLLEKQRRAAAG